MNTEELNFEVLTKADFIADFLEKKNVEAVFQLSGGMIAFIADSIQRLGKSTIVNNRHEQASGFAAEGYARVKGEAAVALGTSGPGATNLITAIGSCFFDSVPAIFITGQVNQKEKKTSPYQRQNGFQELDIVSVTKSITKYSVVIDSRADICFEFNKAWEIAHSGRKGPVLIDIPIDVQQEIYTSTQLSADTKQDLDESSLVKQATDKLLELLDSAGRPLILAGGGIRHSNLVSSFTAVARKLQIPIVQSLMGIDCIENDSPFRVGMLGSYGNKWANKSVSDSDLIICFGTRLDIRQTGNDIESFIRDKTIFRVDIDEHELNSRIKGNYSWKLDLGSMFSELLTRDYTPRHSEFMEEINAFKGRNPQRKEQVDNLSFNPSELVETLSAVFSESNGFVVDVGQHQMWAAQSIRLKENQRFITSGGMGAMGFALPAAIGAAVHKKGNWVVIAGDGCSQLSIAEFQTLSSLGLPVTVCILNNSQHGMVAQFQESNMEGRFTGTRDGYDNPDFTAIASAFGILSRRYLDLNEFKSDREFVLRNLDKPLVLEFVIPQNAKALPKLGYKSNSNDI